MSCDSKKNVKCFFFKIINFFKVYDLFLGVVFANTFISIRFVYEIYSQRIFVVNVYFVLYQLVSIVFLTFIWVIISRLLLRKGYATVLLMDNFISYITDNETQKMMHGRFDTQTKEFIYFATKDDSHTVVEHIEHSIHGRLIGEFKLNLSASTMVRLDMLPSCARSASLFFLFETSQEKKDNIRLLVDLKCNGNYIEVAKDVDCNVTLNKKTILQNVSFRLDYIGKTDIVKASEKILVYIRSFSVHD